MRNAASAVPVIEGATRANPENTGELSTGNGRHGLSPRPWHLTWKGRLNGGFSLLRPSEAEGRHEIPAFVLNDVRTFQALESGFGIFVAKSCSLFVIRPLPQSSPAH